MQYHLQFVTQPGTTTADQALNSIQVAVVEDGDENNNPVTGYNSSLTIGIDWPGQFSSSSTTTVRASNGIATFTNLVPTRFGGPFRLQAWGDSSLRGASSDPFTVTPPIIIGPDALPVGRVGSPYPTTTISASYGSGVKRLTYDVPDTFGLIFSPDSPASDSFTISGTPTRGGTVTFTVTAEDDVGTFSQPKTYTLLVGVPTTRIVKNTDDSGPDSLRYWIDHSNAGDTIQFDPNVFPPAEERTITLSSTLAIRKDLIIDGVGANVRISGGDAVQDFVNLGYTVTLANLKITDGRAPQGGSEYTTDHTSFGGGIENLGWLTLNNCVIAENHAYKGGGIYNGAYLTINNSKIEHNYADQDGLDENIGFPIQEGAGIYNRVFARVEVRNSSVNRNVSWENGGGICNYGELVVRQTAMLGNQSHFAGGGIFNSYSVLPDHSAAYSSFYLENSTIYDNVCPERRGHLQQQPLGLRSL